MDRTRVLYVRTSTGANDGEAQLHQLRAAAAARGGEWVERIELGESGAKVSRPQWDAILREARLGRVRTVMATELCRLGRDTVGVILAMDELHRQGVDVVLLREGIDYGTPVGRLLAGVLASFAQFEREQINARVRAGVRRAQQEGTRSGRPIGRPRAQVDVKRARAMREEGLSWTQVAAKLGVPKSTLRGALSVCENPRPEPAPQLPEIASRVGAALGGCGNP